MRIAEIKKEIDRIKTFLTDEELESGVIEVNNDELIKYLETIGPRAIQFETGNQPQLGKFTELETSTNLWYKDINEVWIIKNWVIKRFFN